MDGLVFDDDGLPDIHRGGVFRVLDPEGRIGELLFIRSAFCERSLTDHQIIQ